MPWEWKEDPKAPPAPPPVYHKPYATVSELIMLTWLVVLFGVMITVAFGLLLGFVSKGYYVTTDTGSLVYSSAAYNGGYTAGVALMVIGCIASLVIGIIMLVRTWTPVIAQERGMVVAMGVIAILSSIIFVGIILGLVLLSRLSNYRTAHAHGAAPSGPPPPPPIV